MRSTLDLEICAAKCGYKGCDTCPISSVCAMPHEAMQGDTLAEKTAYWEERMNEAAEGVNL